MDQATAIKEGRARLRMSQEALAGAAEVSVRTLIRAEQGQRVSGESIRAICAVIGIDATDIDVPAAEPVPPVVANGTSLTGEGGGPGTGTPAQEAVVPDVRVPLGRRLLGLRQTPLLLAMTVLALPVMLATLMGTVKAIMAADAPRQWVLERHAARSVIAVSHVESTGAGWQRTLPSFEVPLCKVPEDFLRDAIRDLLTNYRHFEETCRPRTITIERTRVPGGVLMAVGPVGGRFGRYVARRLSGDPAVTWSVAMGSGRQARDLAWFDPRAIPPDDMPRPGDDETSWLFVRMARATVVGEAGR